MDTDVATVNAAQAVVISQRDKNGFEFKKEWLNGAQLNGATGGGQMAAKLQLSPPAAETASTGNQPEQGTSSSTPSDIAMDGGESIWDQAIEQAFQEALAIYPPCGRRKIIISDEGKMYGRNELIARYIKLRCGKTRTRKQVSSHIQVLARKKAREETSKHKSESDLMPPGAQLPITPKPRNSQLTSTAPIAGLSPHSYAVAHMDANHHSQLSLSPTVAALQAQSLVAASQLHPDITKDQQLATQQLLINNLKNGSHGILPMGPFFSANFPQLSAFAAAHTMHDMKDVKPVVTGLSCNTSPPIFNSSCIMSSDISLVSFTAYVENAETGSRVNLVNIPGKPEYMENIQIESIYDKYPPNLKELFDKYPKDRFYLAKCWANIAFDGEPKNLTYAVDSFYKSYKKFEISVATQVCSFGSKAVEKIECFKPVNYTDPVGPYTYDLEKSSMCEYMTKFISELKKLSCQEWMNNVLENFTVLQIVWNKDADEPLLVMCFLFEVSEDQEANYSVFRLIE